MKQYSAFGLFMAAALLPGCATTPRPQAGPVQTGTQGIPPAMLMADTVAAPIGVADVLNVTVFREQELSLNGVAVDAAGNIQVPLIGTVAAADTTAAQLGEEIRGRLRKYVLEPQVTVNVVTVNSRPVTVEGEVNQPGIFAYQNGMTLLSAMAVARGTTAVARSEEVAVIRTTSEGRYLGVFDLEAIRAGTAPDLALQPRDYIIVGRSGRKQLWRDFLQTVPLIGLFTRF